MLRFETMSGQKGYVVKEGFWLWKKWRMYIVIGDNYKVLDELPASKFNEEEVVNYIKRKYPEIFLERG